MTKKILKWVVLCVFLLSSIATAGPLEHLLKAKDADQLIDLDESDVAVIELDANPSTGYFWDIPDEDAQNMRIIKRVFEPDNPGWRGSSGVEKIYVIARSKGLSNMKLEYKRSFGEKKTISSHRFRFNAKRKFKDALLSYYKEAIEETEDTEDTQAQATTTDTPSGSLSATSLPSSYNWCDENGGCPTVRNQGNCGSCWAFATVGPLEAQIKAAHGVEVDLSEQYLMSCNDEGYGCGGGLWAHEYHVDTYVSGESEAGAVLESVMPYKDKDTLCRPPHAKAYKGSSYGDVKDSETATLKQAILDHGPITVSVCANKAFGNYSGGVFKGSLFCRQLNHGVVLVGWDDSESCWTIRNSWGSDWGENGYMRIKYGANRIGDEDPQYIDYDGSGPIDDDDDDDDSCQEWTATNNKHVEAGRAYTEDSSLGCDFVKHYYAVGSDASLGISGIARTTLYTEDDGSTYLEGNCP